MASGVEITNFKGLNCISHTGYWLGDPTRVLTIPEINYSVIFVTNIAEDIHSDNTAFDIAEAYNPEFFTKLISVVKENKSANAIPKGQKPRADYKYKPEEEPHIKDFIIAAQLNKVYEIKNVAGAGFIDK